MAESMWAPSNRNKSNPTLKSNSTEKVNSKTNPDSTPAGPASTTTTMKVPPSNLRSNSGKHEIPPHQLPPSTTISTTASAASSTSTSTPRTLGEEASRQRAFAALNHNNPSGPVPPSRGGHKAHHSQHNAHPHAHPAQHGQQHAGFTVVQDPSTPGGAVGSRRGGSSRGNRRQEKEELWKSIWGDSDEDEEGGDGAGGEDKGGAADKSESESKSKSRSNSKEQNTSAATAATAATAAADDDDEGEDDPNQPGRVDKSDELESRDRKDPGLSKKKLGVEDSIWAPKNRGVPRGQQPGKKVKEDVKMEELSEKVGQVEIAGVETQPAPAVSKTTPTPTTPVDIPPTPAPEPIKPKTLEPISRFRQTDPNESSGINWADDDEEDEVGGFMVDVMAQWGMATGAEKDGDDGDDDKVEVEVEAAGAEQDARDSGVEDDQKDKVGQHDLATVQEEKPQVQDDARPKAAKVPLSDRIDWDRQAAPADPPRGPTAAGSSSSWRSDSAQQNPAHHQNAFHGAQRGRGRGGHSRQQSYDHSHQNDRQARGGGRRPTELLSLPASPVTPASTAIVTPTPSTTSADEHPVRSKREDAVSSSAKSTPSEGPDARRARTERPKLALQDSTFKRMTRGLLGGAGGQGPARNNEGNSRFGAKKHEGRQGGPAAASPVIPLAPVQPAIATPTGIPDDFGGNDDGWNEVKPKGRSQRGRKRNT